MWCDFLSLPETIVHVTESVLASRISEHDCSQIGFNPGHNNSRLCPRGLGPSDNSVQLVHCCRSVVECVQLYDFHCSQRPHLCMCRTPKCWSSDAGTSLVGGISVNTPHHCYDLLTYRQKQRSRTDVISRVNPNPNPHEGPTCSPASYPNSSGPSSEWRAPLGQWPSSRDRRVKNITLQLSSTLKSHPAPEFIQLISKWLDICLKNNQYLGSVSSTWLVIFTSFCSSIFPDVQNLSINHMVSFSSVSCPKTLCHVERRRGRIVDPKIGEWSCVPREPQPC